VVGTGDFNGDGKGDIAWRDDVGNTSIWPMNGATIAAAGGLGNVATIWSVAVTGDFDGNDTSDFLWRDTSGDPTNWSVQSTSAE
jgi:hypothetical protein